MAKLKLSDSSYYTLYNIIGDIATKLGNDVESILQRDNFNSPSGFLKKAYSESASRAVYYAPRNANDGFPPRQYTLKSTDNFSVKVGGVSGGRGFKLYDDIELTQGYRYKHKSLWGSTRGKAVYPWIWIDEGTTYENRFTGNPRNINQAFTRDWHSRGYRSVFINKMGSELEKRGWEVVG